LARRHRTPTKNKGFSHSEPKYSKQPILVILLTVQDAQDGKEEVEDIEIKADACGNFLFL
jgi:hypothetical protein